MYSIRTEQYFDSAHFLRGYEGKCANIHGHRWCVTVEVSADELNSEGQTRGMVVDFAVLKGDLKELTDALDHCLIIEDGSLRQRTLDALFDEGFRVVSLPFRPTAENFARYFCERMQKKGYRVYSSSVYETENNCARYMP